ncbi:oligosaccharide flippase family protein [Fibrobacter sp. HC4]|uniref:oligosaccharide flippase family protein n=1 Tax=Fibrobacter sp. HC4 TaxID=3239812 RepID=UPI00201847E7|nr:oligosaccharide flippase family protein [Fibrobacter succinogenes]MCL4100575.1 putative O-antigen transporter [Fibrobacter succinogenes]
MLIEILKKHSAILKNASCLTVVEIASLVMPFVTLPYLLRTVGAEKYGMVVFAQTIAAYFSYLINFGLDVSAVRDISINRDSNEKLSKIVCTVLSTKLLFFLISLLLLNFGLTLFPIGNLRISLFYFAFLGCFADVLYPTWFYQGIEKMKYLTIVKTISVLVYTLCIFLFVKNPIHFERVALIQSLCNILAGAISTFILLKIIKVKLVIPSVSEIIATIKDGFPFFLSRISNFFNSSLAKIVCGTFFSMQLVAAYDLMSKVASGMSLPMSMLNQAAYPFIAKEKNRSFVVKFFVAVMMISALLGTTMFISAPLMEFIFAKGSLPEAIPLIKIASVTVFFIGIDVCMGAPILISFGYSAPFNRSVYLASAVLVLVIVGLYILDGITYKSFALAYLLAEITTTIYRFYYCRKYNLIDFSLLHGLR